MADLNGLLAKNELLVAGYVREIGGLSPAARDGVNTPLEIINMIIPHLSPRDRFGCCYGASESIYGCTKDAVKILSGDHGPNSIVKQCRDEISYRIANGPIYNSGYGSIGITVGSSSKVIAEWTLLCRIGRMSSNESDDRGLYIGISPVMSSSSASTDRFYECGYSEKNSYYLNRYGEYQKGAGSLSIYQHPTGRFGDGDVVTMTLDTAKSTLDFKVNNICFQKIKPQRPSYYSAEDDSEERGYIEDGKYRLFVTLTGS